MPLSGHAAIHDRRVEVLKFLRRTGDWQRTAAVANDVGATPGQASSDLKRLEAWGLVTRDTGYFKLFFCVACDDVVTRGNYRNCPRGAKPRTKAPLVICRTCSAADPKGQCPAGGPHDLVTLMQHDVRRMIRKRFIWHITAAGIDYLRRLRKARPAPTPAPLRKAA